MWPLLVQLIVLINVASFLSSPVALSTSPIAIVSNETFVIGYLTGSQRKPGNDVYSRLGQTISGAISLAVDHVNLHKPLAGNNRLKFVVAETYGDESESIRQTARLWTEGKVAAYIGPQETCVHEARMAASFNLPMVSYVSTSCVSSGDRCLKGSKGSKGSASESSTAACCCLIALLWERSGG